MASKFTITAKVDADSLEDEVLWDCKEAVTEILKKWGYEAEVLAEANGNRTS